MWPCPRSASGTAEAVAEATKPSRKLFAAAAAIVALIVLGALAAYYFRNSSTGPAKVAQISHWNKPMNRAVLSPDGHTVAFTSPVAGFDQVFVMLASGGEPLQLTNDSVGKIVDSFSPDGTQIYYSDDFTEGRNLGVCPPSAAHPRLVASGLALGDLSGRKFFLLHKEPP